jgi:hypothetical protein
MFPIRISDPVDALPYEVRLQGQWKRGISYNSPQSTFVENPQYKLVVPDNKSVSKARILALLESQDEETAVNVAIAWSAGKRLARYTPKTLQCINLVLQIKIFYVNQGNMFHTMRKYPLEI